MSFLPFLPDAGVYYLYGCPINTAVNKKISILKYLKEKGWDFYKYDKEYYDGTLPYVVEKDLPGEVKIEFTSDDILINFSEKIKQRGLYKLVLNCDPQYRMYMGGFRAGVLNIIAPAYKYAYYATFYVYIFDVDIVFFTDKESKEVKSILQSDSVNLNEISLFAHRNIPAGISAAMETNPPVPPFISHLFKSSFGPVTITGGGYPKSMYITQNDFYGISVAFLNTIMINFAGNTGGGGLYNLTLGLEINSVIYKKTLVMRIVGDIDIQPLKIPVLSPGENFSVNLQCSGEIKYSHFSLSGEDVNALSLTLNKGVLHGVAPKYPGEYTFNLNVKDDAGNRGERNFTAIVLPELSILPLNNNLPKAILNKKYSARFTLINSFGKVNLSLTAGYPKGLSLSNDVPGLFEGTPQESGDFNFNVAWDINNGERKIQKTYHLTVDSQFDGEHKDMGVWLTGEEKSFKIDIPYELDPIDGIEVLTNNLPSWLQFSSDYKYLSGTPKLSDWTGKKIFMVFSFMPMNDGDIIRESYELYVASNCISIYPQELRAVQIEDEYNELLSVDKILKPTYTIMNAEAKGLGFEIKSTEDGRSYLSGVIKGTKLLEANVKIKVTSPSGDYGYKDYKVRINRNLKIEPTELPRAFVNEQYSCPITINSQHPKWLPNDLSLLVTTTDSAPIHSEIKIDKIENMKSTINFYTKIPGVHSFSISVFSGKTLIFVQKYNLIVNSELGIEKTPNLMPQGFLDKKYPDVKFSCTGAASGKVLYSIIGLPGNFTFSQRNNIAHLTGTPIVTGSFDIVISATDSTGQLTMDKEVIDIMGPPKGMNQVINAKKRVVRVKLNAENIYANYINAANAASFVPLSNNPLLKFSEGDRLMFSDDLVCAKIDSPDPYGDIWALFSFGRKFIGGSFTIHFILKNKFGSSSPYLLTINVPTQNY